MKTAEVASSLLVQVEDLASVLIEPLTSPGQGTLDRDAIYWHVPGYLGAGAGNWRTTPAGSLRAT